MFARMSLPIVIGLLVLPALTGAQSVRGAVVDRGTNAPLSGVVVLLLDSSGSTVARALTDERGEYRLSSSQAGIYRLRTLRIGFQAVTSGPVVLTSGQEITQPMQLVAVPFRLDTVRVVGRSACQDLADSTAATYAVWQQVRTALTATELTAGGGARAFGATIVVYRRVLAPDGRRVLQQDARIGRGFTSSVWRSPGVNSLRREGYVVEAADSTLTYYAPDLDVLLSDEFVEDHCFQIAQESDSGRVGIAFEPTRERRRVPEIRGTIWVNRQSSELERLEFLYTNVSREQEDANAGGEMAFARMSNGAWVISGWSIRMPVLQGRYVTIMTGVRLPGRTVLETYVKEVHVEGGEVALVTRGSDTLWSRPPLELTGSVTDSASGIPIPGARVTVRGAALEGLTDAGGQFTIHGALPGDYVLEVRTPSLDSLNVVHQLEVSVTDGSSPIRIRLPGAAQIAATLCGNTRASLSSADGIVLGKVRNAADSVPPTNTRIVVQWNELSIRNDGVSRRSRWREARTNAQGLFRLCGLPLNTMLTVEAESDSTRSPPTEIRLEPDARFARAELILEPLRNAVAVFSGFVIADSTEQPIADAEVALPGLSKGVWTDERGAFRIADITPGEHEVLVRRIGYGPFNARLRFSGQRPLERRIVLSRVAMLDLVAVRASAVIPSFEEHRAVGLGRFLTREELARQETRRLSDVLAQVQGVHMLHGRANRSWVTSARGQRSLTPRCARLEGGDSTCACFPLVYLDNVPLFGGSPREEVPDVNRMPVTAIEAIEFYAGPAQTPLRYSTLNSHCGVLVIHTRRTP